MRADPDKPYSMYFIVFSGLLLGNMVPGVYYVMAGFQGHDFSVASLCQARPVYTQKTVKGFLHLTTYIYSLASVTFGNTFIISF